MNQPAATTRLRRPASALSIQAALTCIVGACLLAESPPAPVILHLRNGDRLTGVIVREDDQRVVIQSPITGRLTLLRQDIERRQLPGATNSTVADVSTTTNSPATVAKSVPESAASPSAPPPVVSGTNAPVAAGPTNRESPSLWGRGWLPQWLAPFTTNWHGNVGLGMNLGFGTTERQTFFVNANATHSWGRIANTAGYNAAYGLVNNTEAANRMEGTIKTDVFLDRTRHLYAYNLFFGGYDKIRRIDRRLEEGIGLGYRIWERNRLVVNIEAGGQYQTFDYITQPDREIWSARLSENLSWKPSDKFSLTQRVQFLPNLADPADYRVRADLVATYPLLKRLTISLNVINEYESLPANGVDNNDLQITTNINLTF